MYMENQPQKNIDSEFANRWSLEVAARGYYMKPKCLIQCTHELGLKPSEVLILDYLFSCWYDFDNENGVFPTVNTIGTALGFKKSTTSKHIASLERKGFLIRRQRLNNSNIYVLTPTIEEIQYHIRTRHPPQN